MKTWRVEVSPGVGERLVEILTYIFDAPLHNPDAARAVFEDFDATIAAISLMGDRVPIGTHPIMRKRGLRRMNFRRHRFYVVYRIQGDVAQVVRVAHFLEDPNKVLE